MLRKVSKAPICAAKKSWLSSKTPGRIIPVIWEMMIRMRGCLAIKPKSMLEKQLETPSCAAHVPFHVSSWVAWLAFGRSEEHTSELQSRFDLVCRLLL